MKTSKQNKQGSDNTPNNPSEGLTFKNGVLIAGKVGDGRRMRMRMEPGKRYMSWKVCSAKPGKSGVVELERFDVPRSEMTELERMQVRLGLSVQVY